METYIEQTFKVYYEYKIQILQILVFKTMTIISKSSETVKNGSNSNEKQLHKEKSKSRKGKENKRKEENEELESEGEGKLMGDN